MTLEDVLTLARAGYTNTQIAQLAAVKPQTPPAPPAPSAPVPTAPANPYGQMRNPWYGQGGGVQAQNNPYGMMDYQQPSGPAGVGAQGAADMNQILQSMADLKQMMQAAAITGVSMTTPNQRSIDDITASIIYPTPLPEGGAK